LYVDNILIGTYAYDHSDFNWSSEIRLGYSEDCGDSYTGEFSEVRYYDLSEESTPCTDCPTGTTVFEAATI